MVGFSVSGNRYMVQTMLDAYETFSSWSPRTSWCVHAQPRFVRSFHTSSSCSELSANSWLFVCLFDCLFVSLTVCLHIHINLCNQCVFTREESAYIQVFVLSCCSPRISKRWFSAQNPVPTVTRWSSWDFLPKPFVLGRFVIQSGWHVSLVTAFISILISLFILETWVLTHHANASL